MEANVFPHHAGHFGIAAERRQFGHDQAFFRGPIELRPEILVHVIVDRATEQNGGRIEILWFQFRHERPFGHQPAICERILRVQPVRCGGIRVTREAPRSSVGLR